MLLIHQRQSSSSLVDAVLILFTTACESSQIAKALYIVVQSLAVPIPLLFWRPLLPQSVPWQSIKNRINNFFDLTYIFTPSPSCSTNHQQIRHFAIMHKSKDDSASGIHKSTKVNSLYRLTELASSPDRKLVLIDGRVYDITEFIHSHPGGSVILTHCNGEDATDVFSAFHPPEAHETLADFYAGDLHPDDRRQHITDGTKSLYTYTYIYKAYIFYMVAHSICKGCGRIAGTSGKRRPVSVVEILLSSQSAG
jgi:cytochrome b involved in lipid metabolism